jgi:hypothetical protein
LSSRHINRLSYLIPFIVDGFGMLLRLRLIEMLLVQRKLIWNETKENLFESKIRLG